MGARLSVLLLLLVIAAGCAARSGSDETGPTVDPTTTTSAEVAPPPSPLATVDPEETGPDRSVYHVNGTTTANAATWGVDGALMVGVRTLDLYLPANATGLVVEVAWSDAVQDLDAEVHAPLYGEAEVEGLQSHQPYTCEAGQPAAPKVFCNPAGHLGAPDSPSRIVLDAATLASLAQECEQPARPEWGECGVWSLGFRSKDANAMLHWDVYATVFMAGSIPDGYTAVPG